MNEQARQTPSHKEANMRKRHLLTTLLVAMLLIVTSCTNQPSALAPSGKETGTKNADGYVKISAAQLAEKLDQQDFTLVNVHIPYEGDLPGTDLSIPYNEIAGHLDQLPDLDAPIVVYCRSGGMSTVAAKELASHGYTNIIELDGGMNAWTAAGKKLVQR